MSRVTYAVDPPPPRVEKATDPELISRCTRSKDTSMANVITPSQAAKRRYPPQFLQNMAMPVLNKTLGQLLEYRQLHMHPKFAHICNTSYANELGRLYQGVGKGSNVPKKKCIEGTNTLRIIFFEDIPCKR